MLTYVMGSLREIRAQLHLLAVTNLHLLGVLKVTVQVKISTDLLQTTTRVVLIIIHGIVDY